MSAAHKGQQKNFIFLVASLRDLLHYSSWCLKDASWSAGRVQPTSSENRLDKPSFFLFCRPRE